MNVVAELHRRVQFNKCDVWSVVADFVQVQRVTDDARDVVESRQRLIGRRCEAAVTLANRDFHVRLAGGGEAVSGREHD